MSRRILCVVLCLLPCLSVAALVPSNDFSVTKTAPDPQAIPGNDVQFNITVTNNGPSVGDVTMNDQIPAGLSFVSVTASGFSCTAPAVGATSGTVSCSATNVPVSTLPTINVVFHVPNTALPNTTFNNTATVSAANDPNGANDSSTASVTTPALSDLSVTKTGPSTASNDTDVSFTIVVTNGGPSAADNVDVKDPVTGGWTFVSVTAAPGFNCTDPGAGATSGMVDCVSQTPMASGGTATFTIVFHVPADAAPGTEFTNVVTVFCPTDPNDENNSSSTVTTTPAAPTGDVGVVKSGPSAAPPDSDVTYTITLTNNGPNDAQNVQLTDSLPTGVPGGHPMTFVSFTQTSGPTFNCPAPGTSVTCTIASLPAGASATFEYVGHVPSGTPPGTTYSNVANVTSSNDPNAENNSSGTAFTVSSADVGVVKTGPGTPVTAGGATYDYVVTLSNSGPDTATDAAFTDLLPSGVSFVSVVQNNGPAGTCAGGSTVFCSVPFLGNGASAQFTITVQARASDANGSVLSNTATASASSFDPNSNNNSSTAMTTVTTSADLSVLKSGPATVNAGDEPGNELVYTIAVTNSGPSDAQNVSLTDALPPGTHGGVEQASGPTFNCSPAGAGLKTCTIPTLASGASATFYIFTGVFATVPNGTVLSNTANISSTTTDSNPSNNSATVTTTVTTSADLFINKTAPGATLPNSDLTYTITTANFGPSDAQTVTVTDTLPATATFVSINPFTYSCTTPPVGSTGTIICTRASIGAITSQQITFVVHTSPSLTGTISNTATISSVTTDPNPANNTSTAVSSSNATDLAIAKASTAPPVVNQVAYTVTVTNNGPNPALTVTMTDAVPAGTTFVSNTQTSGPAFNCTNPPAGGTGTVSCTIASLAASSSAVFKLVFLPASPGTVVNVATVTSATVDVNPANNSATASAAPPNSIPAASPMTLILLALTLSMIAVMILRR